ncbi:MAG: hypothetical protein V1750_10290 [Acidobacteriota bacterium]
MNVLAEELHNSPDTITKAMPRRLRFWDSGSRQSEATGWNSRGMVAETLISSTDNGGLA